MAKQTAFWTTDSGGKESLHLNGPSLTYEQSYLGYMRRTDDGQWQFVAKDGKELTPASYAQAKRGAMLSCGVEYVG